MEIGRIHRVSSLGACALLGASVAGVFPAVRSDRGQPAGCARHPLASNAERDDLQLDDAGRRGRFGGH